MLKKSAVTKRFYNVEDLTLEEKVRLGFDSEVIEELKKVPPEQKKNRARKRKEDKD